MMATTIAVQKEYGYVVLTAFAGVVVLTYKAMRVGMARKKYNIQPPAMYAENDEKDGKIFNCIQRAHQNTLENFPQTMMCLLLGGLVHPMLSSGAGVVWLLSRIVYAHGYYSGDPSKRSRGAFGYLALLTLYGCTISFGLRLLGVGGP